MRAGGSCGIQHKGKRKWETDLKTPKAIQTSRGKISLTNRSQDRDSRDLTTQARVIRVTQDKELRVPAIQERGLATPDRTTLHSVSRMKGAKAEARLTLRKS